MIPGSWQWSQQLRSSTSQVSSAAKLKTKREKYNKKEGELLLKEADGIWTDS